MLIDFIKLTKKIAVVFCLGLSTIFAREYGATRSNRLHDARGLRGIINQVFIDAIAQGRVISNPTPSAVAREPRPDPAQLESLMSAALSMSGLIGNSNHQAPTAESQAQTPLFGVVVEIDSSQGFGRSNSSRASSRRTREGNSGALVRFDDSGGVRDVLLSYIKMLCCRVNQLERQVASLNLQLQEGKKILERLERLEQNFEARLRALESGVGGNSDQTAAEQITDGMHR